MKDIHTKGLDSSQADVIRRQIEKMEASQDFKASPNQMALLKYVVKKKLSGKAHQIKGYTVATRVFNRGPDFDQSTDPIVSIQACRLRRALERYYSQSGKHDQFRIDIPKGTYVPTFSERHRIDPKIDPISPTKASIEESYPTVLVRSIENITSNRYHDYLCMGLTTELAHEMCRYRNIRVLVAPHGDQEWSTPEIQTDFIIDGNLRQDRSGVKVAVRLIDAKNGHQVWGKMHREEHEATKMIAFQEDLARSIAVQVAGDYAVIPQHLNRMGRNKKACELTTYNAMLRFWECDATQTPESYALAIDALRQAVDKEPECAIAWSMLAMLYSDNYASELVDLPTSLEKAAVYAQQGVSLDPDDQRTRIPLAYIRVLENDIQAAQRQIETALDLNPDALMYWDGIGLTMILCGKWKRGVDLINKAISANPYHRPWARHGLWLNWFRLGEYEKAYQETLAFAMTDLYWYQVMKASNCGQLGRIEEGRRCVQALLELKPDFRERGRILIGKYLKFEEIVERLIEGLNKAGLALA